LNDPKHDQLRKIQQAPPRQHVERRAGFVVAHERAKEARRVHAEQIRDVAKWLRRRRG
jgi:hypothetical protein